MYAATQGGAQQQPQGDAGQAQGGNQGGADDVTDVDYEEVK